MKPLARWLIPFAVLASTALAPLVAHCAEPLRIGVLAFRPKPQTLTQWQPLAQVLRQAVPGQEFEVQALSYTELDEAVAQRRIDFLLTNPGHYVLLAKSYSLSSPLATLAALENGQRTTAFGGVIFTRESRADIQLLGDLQGKTFAATSTESLGGYQMQAYELSLAGIELPRPAKLFTTGMPHDNVVDAVLSGRADVGFVRTGVLEDLVREGRLDWTQIRILNSKNVTGSALRTSTRLYPEWPLAVMPHVDENIARHVAAALFTLEENTPATRAMGIHGFVIPADYRPVEDVLRELRLPPFAGAPSFTLKDVALRYRWQGAAVALTAGLILLLAVHLLAARRRLVVLSQYSRSLIEASLDPLVTISAQGKITDVNTATEQVTGAARADLVGSDFADYFTDPVQARHGYEQAFSKGFVKDYPLVIRHVSGKRTDVLYNAGVYRDDAGQVLGVFAAARDVTERKQAESTLQAASVFTYAREGIMITRADGAILNVNEAFTRITGYARDEVLGKNPRMLNSGRQDQDFYASMWRDLGEKGHWYGELWNRRKSGELFAESLTVTAVKGSDGTTEHYVALFTDVTALREHQSQLEHMAHFDALTKLPNRLLLSDRLRQGLAHAERRGHILAVVYLDLDGFKAVNDQHGHEAGDHLLVALAARMKQALREGDTLARLGGDEFVAVMGDLSDADASVPMLNRLLAAAAQPVALGELALQVSASIGVTFFPQPDAIDADQLLRQADQAMYQAKLAGKSRYHIFDAKHDSSLRVRHESVERIRLALSQNELLLHYQPKVNMRTGTVIGAEALIRWQHPQRGLLAPSMFLPAIEDHPLAISIGEWVINCALAQVAAWDAQGMHLPVSVNVGALQLQQANFVDRLHAILQAHPTVNPSRLELEILETSALDDVAQVSQLIESCAQLGVGFALDDFGTGYSSLTYLKRLRVGVLKIDQSFVRDMLNDPDDLAILQGVIGLAAAFKRQVIAEGVETVEHGTVLLQLGCDLAQGYGIARPMPAHEMPAWARTWEPDPAWSRLPWISADD